MKRQQADLEQELLKVDEQLKTSDYSITDDEFTAFYDAYDSEMKDIKKHMNSIEKRWKTNFKKLQPLIEK